ncbi:MAG: hypothetical protein Q4D61_04310 [Cardiobacteriaceae bacterium]|nr:hypothetical protein [Cardiobacteriaceae bacterium]
MSRYLITFDMDTRCLQERYPAQTWQNAYADIKKILACHGFDNIQGSVYLGDEAVSEAHGTLAIQELSFRYEWFCDCVSNIKFYRLESDLNAQFIVDGVVKARAVFRERLGELEKSLRLANVGEEQIAQILAAQPFALDSLPAPDGARNGKISHE